MSIFQLAHTLLCKFLHKLNANQIVMSNSNKWTILEKCKIEAFSLSFQTFGPHSSAHMTSMLSPTNIAVVIKCVKWCVQG